MEFNKLNMNKLVEKKLQNGYNLEIGELIDGSFALFKQNFSTSGLAMILLGILGFIFYTSIFGVLFGFADIQTTLLNFETMQHEKNFIIGNIIFTTLFSGLIAPVTAGFIHINYLTKCKKEYSVATVFEFYKSKHFTNLFVAYLIIGGTGAIVSTLLSLAKLDSLTFIFQSGINFFTVFTIPLIIYGEHNYSEAIGNSLVLFLKQPLAIVVGLIVAFIGAMLGIIALCIGIFFTLPYIYSMQFSIYDKAIGFDDKSEIEEIGID